MPIAIIPEHHDLADSVKSLVSRIAPAEVLHEALETPSPTRRRTGGPPPSRACTAYTWPSRSTVRASAAGLAIVVAEFGYGAVPGPFVPSVIASALIAA